MNGTGRTPSPDEASFEEVLANPTYQAGFDHELLPHLIVERCRCAAVHVGPCTSGREPSPEWDGAFTPAQQAFHEEVEANTASLMARLGVTQDEVREPHCEDDIYGPCGCPDARTTS